MGKKVAPSGSPVESSSLSCSEKIKGFCQRNERSLIIMSLVLVILLAVLAMGLIMAAGMAVSPTLLSVGIVLLLVSFVIMSAAAIKLAMTKLKPVKEDKPLEKPEASVINISLNSDNPAKVK